LGLYTYFKTQTKKLLEFDWKVSGIRVTNFSLNELAIDITFLFTSKADIEAKINRIYLDLYLQGKNVGYVSEVKPFILPARGSANIPVHVSVSPQDILRNIIDLTLGVGKQKDVMFKLKGFANVSSGFISTTLPIEYETSLKQYLSSITPIKK